MIVILLVATIFGASLFSNNVEAQTDSLPSVEKACCENTKSGAQCVYTDVNDCGDGNKNNVFCDQTDYCTTGSCVSSKTGECEDSVPRPLCNLPDTWLKTSCDQRTDAQLGCCKLPTGYSYITQAKCNAFLTGDLKLNEVFDTKITNELECLSKSNSRVEGCCVATGKFTTQDNCQDKTSFRSGMLCSNPDIRSETRCEPHFKTGCLTEKDEVYWFDSCGNPENIYSGIGSNNEDLSYNNGLILKKQFSCDPNSDNVNNPSCGNCDFFQGSICGNADSEFKSQVNDDRVRNMCVSLDCQETKVDDRNTQLDGRTRNSGDNWCQYEGATGEGKDLVGSRQYVRKCYNGEEYVEACGERRTTVCVQGDVPTEITEFQSGLSAALCAPNRAVDCVEVNKDEGTNCGDVSNITISIGAECDYLKDDNGNVYEGQENEYDDCKAKQLCRKKKCDILAGSCFWNDDVKLCAPEVSLGDLGKQENTCFGKIEFQSVYAKKGFDVITGDYDCVEGCDVYKSDFATGFSNYCRSLGDCGYSYNVEGKVSDTSFRFTGPQKKIKGIARKAQTISPEAFSEFAKASEPLHSSLFTSLYVAEIILAGGSANYNGIVDESWYQDRTGKLKGIAGSLLVGILSWKGLKWLFGAIKGGGSGPGYGEIGGLIGPAEAPAHGFLASSLGKIAAFLSNPIVIVVLSAFAVYFLITYFFSATKTLTYTISCDPYVAPAGGNDCEKCNTDYEKCDDYKCTSLGQSCQLLNKGSGNETCTWVNKGDVIAPVINPLAVDPITNEDIQTQANGYVISGEQEYRDLQIGIKTDKISQCKVSKERSLGSDSVVEYNRMSDFFGDNQYKKEHIFTVPIINEAEDDIIAISDSGDYDLYVRCKSANTDENNREIVTGSDYKIGFTIAKGPDTGSPIVKGFNIINNAKLKFNTKNITIAAYVDDESELIANGGCKYSSKDESYQKMLNNLSCGDSRIDTIYGRLYACGGILGGLQNEQDNVYYFRCQDINGNVNRDASYPAGGLHLFVSRALNITNVEPSGTIFDKRFNLTTTTVRGAEEGRANCYWTFNDYFDPGSTKFDATNSTEHSYEFVGLQKGYYDPKVWCRDIAGNEAIGRTNFTVEIDEIPPSVKKIYTDSTRLYVEMDEDSICEYNNLPFSFGNGNRMPDDDSKLHKAALDENNAYYIICRDRFENEASFTVYP